MVYLSVISFTASILYFYAGLNAFKSNTQSKLFRVFFFLTLSLSIWSFTGGFLYLAENVSQYSFWNKAGSFGWCTFEALVLYFVVVLTDNKWGRHWYARVFILAPAFVFIYMVLFLFGPDIDTPPVIETIFYTGNFLYNFLYLAISILLLFLWGYRSKSRIQKKQANVIVVCSIIPFLLTLLTQDILPAFTTIKLPNMGQIYGLILFLGVSYAITRYQFMSIPTTRITTELFHELSGLTFLTDAQGMIMKVNQQACVLLGYKQEEILGNHIKDIVRHEYIDRIMAGCETIHERLRFSDIAVPVKSGGTISFNISIIPLQGRTSLMQGFLIIGEDIRVTKWLQEEIERHKQTNEKLYNSELLFRRLLEITPISILLSSKKNGTIVYLNAQAAKLLEADREALVGSPVSVFFVNQKDRAILGSSLKEKEGVSKSEIRFRRWNGTEFIGMITMVPSIYNEEEVALTCIVDVTEQKNVEETLKHNNEEIIELNKMLMIMNNRLVHKSIKDGLTNLYNHQHMNEVLEEKLKERTVTRENLCLMMLDIDYFKLVNDRFGHQTGDRVLALAAELITKNVRRQDYTGRYGGEEFIVILPGISLKEAGQIAEEIRRSIQDYDFGTEGLKVTISIGVVQAVQEMPNTLINRADILLYQAKSKGRNRVEMEEPDGRE